MAVMNGLTLEHRHQLGARRTGSRGVLPAEEGREQEAKGHRGRGRRGGGEEKGPGGEGERTAGRRPGAGRHVGRRRRRRRHFLRIVAPTGRVSVTMGEATEWKERSYATLGITKLS